MRALLPGTLKARAILVFFAVFTLSHIASVILYERNRNETILLTEATDLADRIIGIVNLARSFPDTDRREILAAAETQFLTMYPNIISIDEVACQDNAFSRHMSARITAAFEELPGFGAQVCARSLDTPQFFARQNQGRGFDVLVFIDFPDDKQSVFHTILPEGGSLLEDNIILYLIGVGLLSLVAGIFLINRAVNPLDRLARAADEFGTQIESTPLSEEGPREVARAAKAFNRMQVRLERLIDAQTHMLAAISHDLRSAITRLQLRAELLPDSSEREGLLRVVSDMRAMVQSVLDFVRGYNPKEDLRSLNVAALIESLCEDLKEEGFNVSYECGTGATLTCRPSALKRALQNLIDNGINYAGCARVTLEKQHQSLVIAVEDDGPGIPESEIANVMKPFFRLDKTTKSASPGIGLGLSIAQNVAQTLGGTLTLTNRVQGGLRAEMRLPLDTH